MEEVFRRLHRHKDKITEAMEAITFEVMEVGTEEEVLVFLSYCQYLALVEVGFFGFLILMSIVGVIVNSFKSSSNFSNASNNSIVSQSTNPSKVSLIQFQIGLLASAKEIQVNLRGLAASSNTSTSSGLQRVLQDTTLSLLRKPELWVYSNIETGSVPYTSAESTFNRISITERSKLKAELTSNYSGQISSSTNKQSNPGDSDSTNEYIAITILVATKKRI